jgi:predicted flap endonuclease-1-like 5' DNA nuclease
VPAHTGPRGQDDLKRVEGIGPKISALLQAAGITAFSQLASTGVGELKAILMQADLRLADPGTWPEQARLAAAGDWDAFEALKDELKGGRRI